MAGRLACGTFGIVPGKHSAGRLACPANYKNDSTHVSFFSRTTFKWLARKWQTKIIFADKDVILFCKKGVQVLFPAYSTTEYF